MKTIVFACMLIGGIIISAPQEAMSAAQQELVIFDFKNSASFKSWQAVDDRVMGGMSEGRLQPGAKGTALFAGTLSLENNGGFCTVSSRRKNKTSDLSGFQGIAVRLKGDGKKYKFTIKADTRFIGFAYQYDFSTIPGEWVILRAPFKEFVARFRGMPKPDAPALNSAKITSFGFLIADRQAGPFALEVEWLKAY